MSTELTLLAWCVVLAVAQVLQTSILRIPGELTFYGAWTYLIARLVYVPLYAAGIPYIRSMAWLASLIGLAMVLYAILAPY